MHALSERGLAFIKRWEGYSAKPYRDSAGYWTVGYGHLIKPEEHDSLMAGVTESLASAILQEDVRVATNAVNKLVTVGITQAQFDALVSFTFNVGADIDADDKAEGLGDSSLLKYLNNGRPLAAAEEFLKWNKAGGRVVQGLSNRRAAERQLFLSGEYNV